MGRLATYYIENHKIEIVKSLFGKEKVLLNGKIISKKPSIDASEHIFDIDANRYKIVKRKRSDAEKMNAFEIFKNSAPVALINIESQTSMKLFVLIVAIGLGLGFMVGVMLYNMVLV